MDWNGFPVRVAACLSSHEQACELVDWRGPDDEPCPRRLHEEYLEWRVVRDRDGAIRRVELTSELPDYWRDLAAYCPELLLQLVAEFAGEESVPRQAVYGACDPFGSDADPAAREEAFASQMLSPQGNSPYSNGQRAICCLVQASNTLASLVELAVAAAVARPTIDNSTGNVRPMTAAEAIPLMRDSAVAGRASDPVLVERLGRLAYEGRRCALQDPLGIYLQGVEHTRLRLPDGAPVAAEWFSFSRGIGPAEASDGRARFQRLVFEIPADVGYAISGLTDIATEMPIRFGSQIAELVQLAVFLRNGPPGVVGPAPPQAVTRQDSSPANACRRINERQRALLAVKNAESTSSAGPGDLG